MIAPIGRGGMGEVYRARDPRLRREVALKVLPEAFARDPERLARFEREAQLLASLNHPNIAAIYGIEEAEGVRALVLELVEGPTLADRIDAGPLAPDEALAIASQIADALDAAHERGVIHRDLKPANVKVRVDGSVKVLDFGLAKAYEPLAVAAGSDSPTVTAEATQPGTLLGTAAYMSPEQARGRPVDKRTDVWAFGCVLFEMLTGQRAFGGESVSETIAELLKGEPSWISLPTTTPGTVRVLLQRCLDKDPRRRLRDLGDARLLMDGAFGEVLAPAGASAAPATSRLHRDDRAIARRRWPIVVGTAALVLGLGLALGLFLARGSGTGAARSHARFLLSGPPSLEVTLRDLADTTHIAISPDGSRVVYTFGPPPQLFLREMGDISGRVLEDTNHALSPFFSPDGEWIGFMQRKELRKVSASGGAIETVCELPRSANPRGGTWNREGTIVFGLDRDGLYRVAASGGPPVALTDPPEGTVHSWPHFLPGGESLVFEIRQLGADGPGEIAVLELASGEWRSLNIRGSGPRYLMSGHLVFALRTTLFAVRFDAGRREVEGEPVAVLEKVTSFDRSGASEFAVASDGSLAYVTGEVAVDSTRGVPVWVDREGKAEAIPNLPVDTYASVRVSPDGKTIALDRGKGDLWTYDVARATLTPLTTGAATDSLPVWTRDGRRIVYRSNRGGEAAAIYWQNADGSGQAERLASFEPPIELALPESFTPDGVQLLLTRLIKMQMGIGMLRVDGDRKLETLIESDTWEGAPAVSPDGRWIAYHNDGGRNQFQVYVERFPALGDRRQVSVDGGHLPQWSADGRELYYTTWDRQMFAVPIETEPRFEPGLPRLLFEGPYLLWWGLLRTYQVAPDGRFLMIREMADEGQGGPQVIYAQGWADDVTARLASR